MTNKGCMKCAFYDIIILGGDKMILSVSRKTDIPALYSKWFLNRLDEGFVLVPSQKNPFHLTKIFLSPKTVDIIVFWTKNPLPLMGNLSKIDKMGYKYYFQFTLTPYDKKIEPGVPSKTKIIETFIALSKQIGKEKVIWRYDPIIITEKYDLQYHKSMFDLLCTSLSSYTNKCVISFLDVSKVTNKSLILRTKDFMKPEQLLTLSKELSIIAKKHNLILESCSERIDLQKYDIKKGACIDKSLIEKILNEKIIVDKDRSQKKECSCVSSIDIGTYNTCTYDCKYCYANYSPSMIGFNFDRHSPKSSLLIGHVSRDNTISVKKVSTIITKQISIFDL